MNAKIKDIVFIDKIIEKMVFKSFVKKKQEKDIKKIFYSRLYSVPSIKESPILNLLDASPATNALGVAPCGE
jgi:hypothetical protein